MRLEIRGSSREFEEFKRMVEELKDYSRSMNFEIFLAGHSDRTRMLLEMLGLGSIVRLTLPEDYLMFMLSDVSMRWIHQLWVTMLICKALNVQEFLKPLGAWRAYWRIEQGKPWPSFAAKSPHGTYSFWIEPQRTEEAHLEAFFTRRRGV